jgi:hypothetical protein
MLRFLFLPLLSLALPAAAAAPDPCRAHGAAATAEDAALALEACTAARARFEELFGRPVPDVRIEIRGVPGYRVRAEGATAVVRWPASSALPRPASGGAAAERHAAMQWREMLPHEIGHALLVARFYPDGFEPHAGYGTPLPDWLEEGAAIWSEPPATRRARLAQARALPPAQRDLHHILGMTHPALRNAAALASRDGAPLPADPVLWAFYPQSIAVVAFVHAAGGRAAMLELVRRLLDGESATRALLGLPGLPSDDAGLRTAWDAWLAE